MKNAYTATPWKMVKVKSNDVANVKKGFHIYSQPDKDKMYITICFVDNESDAKLIKAAPVMAEGLLKLKKQLMDIQKTDNGPLAHSIVTVNGLLDQAGVDFKI